MSRASVVAREYRGTALGDGSLKPGAVVGIDSSTGKFVAINPGTADNFVGIVEDRYYGEDTTVDGDPWPYIIPRAGHLYKVLVGGLSATLHKGDPLKFGNGVLTAATGITDNAVAIADEDISTSDTEAWVRWL